MSPLDQALDLADQGYKVFFCKPDKSPTCPSGFYGASNDPGTLFDLWWHYPGPLVAIATGAASGIDIVDIDIKHLSAEIWWQRNAARLSATRTHATRGGGSHLLFRHRAGMRSSASRIARGVDVRADGGYIVWWPAAGLPVLCDEPPAAWPEWLAALADHRIAASPAQEKPKTPKRRVNGSGDNYGDAARRRAVERILNAPRGQQEHVINREAFSLGTLVGAKVITEEEAYQDLLAIADQVPSLDPSRPWRPGEVSEKIKRGLAQGVSRPRAPIRS